MIDASTRQSAETFMKNKEALSNLCQEIKACSLCEEFLPHKPNPIFSVGVKSKIILVGQAPGRVVDETGIPFNDRSGDTLRRWLGVTSAEFYDNHNFSILPMGFCYPGTGKSGDFPPSKACAPQWHSQLNDQLKKVELTILIGKYAQNYYLRQKENLTTIVKNFDAYLPTYFPIVHPSPLNFRWHAKNKWFEEDVVPILQLKINEILKKNA